MAENGPLATTVDDAALMLSVLAGRPSLASVGDPGALRIAVSTRGPAGRHPGGKALGRRDRETASCCAGPAHMVTEADPPYGLAIAPSDLVRWIAGTELDARPLLDRSR